MLHWEISISVFLENYFTYTHSSVSDVLERLIQQCWVEEMLSGHDKDGRALRGKTRISGCHFPENVYNFTKLQCNMGNNLNISLVWYTSKVNCESYSPLVSFLTARRKTLETVYVSQGRGREL